MFLLVGLGNPGHNYEKTRHNAGFIALDEIIRRYSFKGPKAKFHSELYEGTIDDHKVIALKPMTFMNKSGLAVGEAVKFLKIPHAQVIALHDDLDLIPGKIRVKTGGGHGGHNGLRDMDDSIGKDYMRVRIGIGHPGDKDEVSDYVLHAFSKVDAAIMEQRANGIAEALPHLLSGNASLFMTRAIGD